MQLLSALQAVATWPLSRDNISQEEVFWSQSYTDLMVVLSWDSCAMHKYANIMSASSSQRYLVILSTKIERMLKYCSVESPQKFYTNYVSTSCLRNSSHDTASLSSHDTAAIPTIKQLTFFLETKFNTATTLMSQSPDFLKKSNIIPLSTWKKET